MSFKILAILFLVLVSGFSVKARAQEDGDSEIIPESTEYPMPPNGATTPPAIIDESDSGPSSDVDDFQD